MTRPAWRRVALALILALAIFAAYQSRGRAQEAAPEDVSPFVSVARLSLDELEGLAARYFPPREVRKAARVAECESEGAWWSDHGGYDRRLGIVYRLVGLWQIEATIWLDTARRIAGPDADLRTPHVNAATAAHVWQQSGWYAWPICGARS